MTCIIGMQDLENDCAWIGGDALTTSGNLQRVLLHQRFFIIIFAEMF
jgi:hypothetical protein